MTATDELRRLLDERGVEWEADDRKTYTFTYWGDWAFTEPLDAKPGTLGAQCELMCIPATPEQAIAATLGEKPRDKTEEWLLKACNQATHDYVTALKKLVQDWQVLYDERDYGDCCRLRKRMQDLGIEVSND